VIRVVLTGSESTGKSTLAAELASRYDAPLVPEFVRGYAEQRGGIIEFADHGPITRGQIALEDEHVARGGRLIVQDTDLLSTVVYCQHYFGRCPAWIEETAASRRPNLYLLCEIDVPWVADGVRDRGDRREEMQALFRDEVRASGVRSVALIGDRAARLSLAVSAIDSVLSS
jgi:NadR type nicotinamide-nucleotide adenylyltransferase